jgi:hypothetical protein
MDTTLEERALLLVRKRVPRVLLDFGRALEAADALPDGWPYFLERTEKFATEYALWLRNGAPAGPGDEGWQTFLAELFA